MQRLIRPYLTAGVALVGAGVIAVVPMPTPRTDLAVRLTADGAYVVDSPDHLAGLIVGGSGTPIPQLNDDWVNEYNTLYLQRILPGATPQGVFTPEGASPIFSGVKSLPLDTSIAQGEQMLNSYITENVDAGNTVGVTAHSQSSMISGFVMDQLQQEGVPADAVKFVLTGDPNNPDGGLFERLYPGNLPALGIDTTQVGGATPPDTIYHTSIYTLEYDGFADFPKYPLNVLSDLNAEFGWLLVHPIYRALPSGEIDDAIKLPTTPDYDGVTTYYMMPFEGDLPLLAPLRAIPLIGKPLADLLQPDLTQIVNLGYDNPDNLGWDAGPANVPTGFGVLPSLDQVETAIKNMGPGTEQGIQAFLHDLSDPVSIAGGLPSHVSSTDVFSSPTDFINTVTGAFSQLYALLLPTADVLTSLAVSVPTYQLSMLMDNLDDPLNAFGLAAGGGMAAVTSLGMLELGTVLETVNGILPEFGLPSIPFETLTPPSV